MERVREKEIENIKDLGFSNKVIVYMSPTPATLKCDTSFVKKIIM